MVNSVDLDQTAQEQSDLGLHCLLRPICYLLDTSMLITRQVVLALLLKDTKVWSGKMGCLIDVGL